MKRKVNQLRVGSILSFVQMGLNIIIGLTYTPIMIRLLGQSEYGLYNTASSTIAMLSVLNLGFNSAYIRFYAKEKVEKDSDAISRLNGLFLTIFLILGSIALICGLFITGHLEFVFSNGLTANEYPTAKVLMLLLTINLAVSFPMGVFSNIISAHERFVFLKSLGIIRNVFGPMVTLPLLLAGYRSIAMVSVSVALNICVDAVYMFYVFRVLECRFVFSNYRKGILRSIVVFTSFIAINMVIDQINWNIDKILLTRFKGTTAVAIYSVGYTLYQYYSMFSSSISGVFTPRIHMLVNSLQNDLDLQRTELTKLFTRVGRLQFIVLTLIWTGFVFLGQQFIERWAGVAYHDSYYVALLLMIPASIALTQNLGLEIQRAQNKHKFRSIAYAIMAIFNLILSIFLCQKYGAIGSAIGTAISLVLANGLIMNIYYHKRCNIDIISFWKSIINLSKGLILPVLFGIIVLRFFKTAPDYLHVFMIALIYSFLYFVSMWFMGFNEYEKDLVKSILLRIKK